MNRPDYLRRMVERSSRYLHHIVEELERRGMPTELPSCPWSRAPSTRWLTHGPMLLVSGSSSRVPARTTT